MTHHLSGLENGVAVKISVVIMFIVWQCIDYYMCFRLISRCRSRVSAIESKLSTFSQKFLQPLASHAAVL